MEIEELTGASAAPDATDAEQANGASEPVESKEAENEAANDEQDKSLEATEAETRPDAAEPSETIEAGDDEAEPKETKSQRKRRLQRERQEELRRAYEDKTREVERLEERLAQLTETDPNAAEDYDATVQQNAANKAIKALEQSRLDALKAEQKRAEEDAQTARVQAWQEKVAELDHIKDFAAKVYSNEVPFTDAMVGALQELERGPEVAYHLANNVHEVHRLNSLGPVQLGIELGALQAKVSLPKPKTKSTAPEPLKTLEGSSTEPDNDPAKMSFNEYRAYRGIGV